MKFAQPAYLWLLILLPITAAFFWLVGRNRRRALARLGNPTLLTRLSASVSFTKRHWKQALILFTLLCLTVALARPQLGSRLERVEQRGIEVVIALDTSSSMLAQDLEPNRLEQAKLAIADLMDMVPGAQFALVVFAGESFIQFPLTADVGAALMLINAADTSIVSLPGTAIGDAIRTSLRAFNERSVGQRVLVLFTDGEDHDTDPMGAAEEAAEAGVMIYPIGFGNPAGEPIPEFDAQGDLAGYKKGEQGNTVLSRLDEATLRLIARTTGGEYFRATPGGQEMRDLADEISALRHGETEGKMLVQHIERFQIPVALALMGLIAEFMLSDRRRQREASHA